RQDVLPVQPGIVPAAVPGPGAVPPNPVGQVQPGFGSPQGDAQALPASSPAQQRLETLRTKVEEKLAALDNAAPILSGSQLQQMQQRQMRIRETLMMGQEAKALAEVLKVLDDISGDGSKSGGASDEDQKRKVDEAVQQALAARKLEEENAPKPLVASIHGSGGSLRAVVLVPYVGQFTVRAGTQLPEGMRVASVTDNGVEVVKNGKRFPLAFGTVVPGMRPQPGAGPQSLPARTVQMPIGASPLPMGG
ncbi:type IV pilus biogenesis protein PilP, partial [Methylobacterium hispanicum]